MLVLTRKIHESVICNVGGREIKVTVVKDGKTVRLGFTAPDDVQIYREELEPNHRTPH